MKKPPNQSEVEKVIAYVRDSKDIGDDVCIYKYHNPQSEIVIKWTGESDSGTLEIPDSTAFDDDMCD